MICTGTGAADTAMLNDFAAVRPVESPTCTVKFDDPAVVGVPAIDPELSDNPAGSEPDAMDQV